MENIISQLFFKKHLFLMTDKQIKAVMGIERLKFSREKIASYLYLIDYQNLHKLHLLKMYNELNIKDNLNCCYSNFCRNMTNISKLIPFVLQKFNDQHKIDKTEEYVIADTTLIINKKSENILKSDWFNRDVTARPKNKYKSHKVYYCGYKTTAF